VRRLSSWRSLVPVAAGVLLLAASRASAGGVTVVAHSTFHDGAEGWTSFALASDGTKSGGGVAWNDPTPPGSLQGNPGGFLLFQDANAGPGTSYIKAPDAFLGNYYSSGLAQAGVLRFDDKIFSSGKDDKYDNYQVKLIGGPKDADVAVWTGSMPPVKDHVTDWDTVSVPLYYSATPGANPTSGWTVVSGSFAALLRDVKEVDIRIELVNNNVPGASSDDVEGIDNVYLSAVPEPGSLTLAGVGLGGFGLSAWRRWRKRRPGVA
jgi:hypothetical protein